MGRRQGTTGETATERRAEEGCVGIPDEDAESAEEEDCPGCLPRFCTWAAATVVPTGRRRTEDVLPCSDFEDLRYSLLH